MQVRPRLRSWAIASALCIAVVATVAEPLVAVTAADPLTSKENVQVSSIFRPVSPPANAIRDLSWLVLAISAGIFAVVGGLLVYSIVVFRQRKGEDNREPPQVYGSNPIELAWTVVPLLIVFVLFLVTARTISDIENATPPPDALHVTVVGHQWWWEFHYPDQGFTTANELHIPTSTPEDRRPTFLDLQSADVVHSFWIPRLNGKTDVIPNRNNRMWIEPMEPGTYLGQCAEYCGTQHAHMLLRVIAHPPGEFDQWVAEQQQPPVDDPSVQAGRDMFQRTACINCHTIGETAADGTFGPDLSHLMSRETIGAGVAANTAENLHAWVRDPQTLKPGCHMPDMKVSSDDVDQLVAYLLTLK